MRRYAVYSMLLIGSLAAAMWLRTSMVLPYHDALRFHHWRHSEAMTSLAEALWSESDFDRVANIEGRIQAGSLSEFRVGLTDDQESRYLEPLAKAHVGSMSRSVHGTFVTIGGGWRFHANLLVTYSYNKHAGWTPDECEGQYRQEDTGICRIRLDDYWSIHYLWYPTH